MVGFDAVHNRSVQRSFTVHGDATVAEQRRRELVDAYGVSRVDFTTAGARLTVGELMERFLDAPHIWKPATLVSHRPVVRALVGDPLARRRLVTLTAGDARAAVCRWQAEGVSVPTVSARWLVLRSAISWAVGEGVLRRSSCTAAGISQHSPEVFAKGCVGVIAFWEALGVCRSPRGST